MKVRVQCGNCRGVGGPWCDCGLSHLGGHDHACAYWEECLLCHGEGERVISVIELGFYRLREAVSA